MTRHLSILVADLQGTDSGLEEVFERWAKADLLDATALIDLDEADRDLEATTTWVRAGSQESCSLEEVLTSEIWPEVTLVSVRTCLLANLTTRRIAAERTLLDVVQSAFLQGCQFRSATVASTSPEDPFGQEPFDPNWDLHLLHDSLLIADPDVAVLQLKSRDRPVTCLMTAVLASGGFRWQDAPLLDISDNAVGNLKPARIVRSQLRVVNAGRFLDDVLAGAFPESGPWTVPPDVQAIPASNGAWIPSELADRIASETSFHYQPFQHPPAPRAEEIGILAGLRLFMRNFLAAAKKAPLIVIDRIATTVGEGIASAANQLTFGDHSTVIMRFRPGLSRTNTDDLVQRLQEVGMPDIQPADIPDPRPWNLLREAAFGLVDGGDLPAEIPPPMRDTQRLLYTDPASIGPPPDDEPFHLTRLELELLDLGEDMQSIGSMDVLDARAVEQALAGVDFGETNTPAESDTIRRTPPNATDGVEEESDPPDRLPETQPDLHRPSHPDFDATGYTPIAAFYQGTVDDIPSEYQAGQAVHAEALRSHDLIEGPWQAEGRCDHCGASFHHGVCYEHQPSGLLVHVGQICARKSGLSGPTDDPSQAVLRSLRDRWQRWLNPRRQSLLWQVGRQLADALDRARQNLADGMAEREAPDQSIERVDAARAKLRLSTLRWLAASILTALTALANVVFVFIPIWWLLLPVVGAVGALVSRGMLLTRDLARMQTLQASGFRTRQLSFLKIQHSARELTRLAKAREQFDDWQAVIRNVVHRPFGPLSDTADTAPEVHSVDRPQSFVTATAHPAQHQLRSIQIHAKSQTFTRSWLSNTFHVMRDRWRTDYAQDVLWAGDRPLEPESDNSPAGAVRARIPETDEEVFSPREDFRNRVTSGRLQPSVVAKLTEAIVERLGEVPLDELLSPVVVSGPGRALQGRPPEAFLRGLQTPLTETPNFQPEIFGNDPAALRFRTDNVTTARPPAPIGAEQLPPLFMPEVVSPGRDLVFATFRLAMSDAIEPHLLRGFGEGGGGPSTATSPVDPGDDAAGPTQVV